MLLTYERRERPSVRGLRQAGLTEPGYTLPLVQACSLFELPLPREVLEVGACETDMTNQHGPCKWLLRGKPGRLATRHLVPNGRRALCGVACVAWASEGPSLRCVRCWRIGATLDTPMPFPPAPASNQMPKAK